MVSTRKGCLSYVLFVSPRLRQSLKTKRVLAQFLSIVMVGARAGRDARRECGCGQLANQPANQPALVPKGGSERFTGEVETRSWG